MGRGARNGGRGAHNNNNSNTYGNKRGGGNSTNKLDVSALGLVSPLCGGTGRGALKCNAMHSTVGLGGLGGLPQQTQLQSLLGGGTNLTGGVSNHKTSVSDYINVWHLRVLTLVMLI